jgi:dTDP-glucose pyrophosphorylase
MLIVAPDATLLQAMQAIDRGRLGIALVVDSTRRLKGTVTDGDLRRAILRSADLTSPVAAVMNRRFTSVTVEAKTEAVLELMRIRCIRQIPVINPAGELVGLHELSELSQPAARPNWAVVMAGGMGQRLRPLTERTPKVMLHVGERPILENIIRLLVAHRFEDIFISINYLGSQITDYFGDGRALNCRITYLNEPAPLGTAGPLSLLPSRPADPLLVLNGDLATDLNLSALMDYHQEAACLATACVSEYVHEVPFGVIRCEDEQVIAVEEKPSYRQLINAGIYVLSPSLLDLVPANREFMMPDLLAEARRNGYPLAAFPIRERWSDIGRPADYDRVREDWDSPKVS